MKKCANCGNETEFPVVYSANDGVDHVFCGIDCCFEYSLKPRLETLMQSTGQHVMVRFDPLRDTNRFTVVVDGKRIGDTNDPVKLLS